MSKPVAIVTGASSGIGLEGGVTAIAMDSRPSTAMVAGVKTRACAAHGNRASREFEGGDARWRQFN